MTTMRETLVPTPRDDRPKRRLLGLAVLLLTLGAGYGAAQLDVGLPTLADLAGPEPEERLAPPTRAEIMAEIEAVAARHRVPAGLVAAIIAVESEFNPRAVSRRGAQGLMQLMPATAANLDVQDSFDARENIEGGVKHLRVLMDRYRNDLPLVLAAYNAGDRAVLAYGGVPPYPETRRYIIRVLRRYDPEAARAASRRIYAGRSSLAPALQPRLPQAGVLATPAVLRVSMPAREIPSGRGPESMPGIERVSLMDPLPLSLPAPPPPASSAPPASRPLPLAMPPIETP